MTTYQTIKLDIEDGIATLARSRPERKNARGLGCVRFSHSDTAIAH